MRPNAVIRENRMRYLWISLAFQLSIGLVTGHALGQPAPAGGPVRLRGAVDHVNAEALDMTTRSGSKVHVLLPASVRVTFVVAATMSDIAPGSYIGTAAIRQPDGSLRALEVHVFPPNMRGRGEGFRPFQVEGGGEATMTNGTVGSLVVTNGRVATVHYANGEKQIFIPDDVPVVSFEEADRSAVTPGAQVIVSGNRGTDDTITAAAINVGKNGLTPPI